MILPKHLNVANQRYYPLMSRQVLSHFGVEISATLAVGLKHKLREKPSGASSIMYEDAR